MMKPHFDAYLQYGAGTAGPFKTEQVEVCHSPGPNKGLLNPPFASSWEAKVDGGWRRIWIDGHNHFIRLHGETIRVQVQLHPTERTN